MWQILCCLTVLSAIGPAKIGDVWISPLGRIEAICEIGASGRAIELGRPTLAEHIVIKCLPPDMQAVVVQPNCGDLRPVEWPNSIEPCSHFDLREKSEIVRYSPGRGRMNEPCRQRIWQDIQLKDVVDLRGRCSSVVKDYAINRRPLVGFQISQSLRRNRYISSQFAARAFLRAQYESAGGPPQQSGDAEQKEGRNDQDARKTRDSKVSAADFAYEFLMQPFRWLGLALLSAICGYSLQAFASQKIAKRGKIAGNVVAGIGFLFLLASPVIFVGGWLLYGLGLWTLL
jgi:hypothetical protein